MTETQRTLLVLAIVAIPVAVGIMTCGHGEEVAVLAVAPAPGSVDLELSQGDQLNFTTDTNILWRNFTKNAKPEGCVLDVRMLQGTTELASTSCDIMSLSSAASIGGSSRTSTDAATGMRQLVLEGTRVACRLTAPVTGPVTLKGSTNLETCVPRGAATAHVFREAAKR